MRKCEDCGAYFAEGSNQPSYLGECHGRPVYEEGEHCPVCGGAEHQRVESCQGCADWYPPTELLEGYCPRCGQALQAELARQVYAWARGLWRGERAYLREALLEEEAVEALRRQLLDP